MVSEVVVASEAVAVAVVGVAEVAGISAVVVGIPAVDVADFEVFFIIVHFCTPVSANGYL